MPSARSVSPPESLDATIAALADPARRQVVEMLKNGPRRAGEIAAGAGMSGPAMSRHLRVLRRTKLIVEERVDEDARVKMYRLSPGPFDELQGWLDEVRVFWTDQLHALKGHAEAKTKAKAKAGQGRTGRGRK